MVPNGGLEKTGFFFRWVNAKMLKRIEGDWQWESVNAVAKLTGKR